MPSEGGFCWYVELIILIVIEMVEIVFLYSDTQLLQPIEGDCEQQYLSIQGSIWPIGVPKICGHNDGQHFYVEIDKSAKIPNGGLGVEFAVTTKLQGSTDSTQPYKWGLWITQIKCDGSRPLEAPKGCFQYFTQSSGYFMSFNYQESAYLNNQVILNT